MTMTKPIPMWCSLSTDTGVPGAANWSDPDS